MGDLNYSFMDLHKMNGYLIIDFYILRDLLNVINNLFSNYNLDLFN